MKNKVLSLTESTVRKEIYDFELMDIPLFLGDYNKIEYNPSKDIINIKNDELAKLSLFFYIKNNKVIISNNFWKIIENLDDNDIEIDEVLLSSMLLYYRIPSEKCTFIKNLYVVPPASIVEITLTNFTYKINKYWDLINTTENKPSVNQATEQLNSDIGKLFSSIKKYNPDQQIIFGNSGGLDSRLIPFYSKKFHLNTNGFIIGNKYPRLLFKSTSHQNANKIANKLNFNHIDISYKIDSFKDRFYLDIRNNPLGPSQVYKNPFRKIPKNNMLICGGNGFIVSNDSNKWSAFDKLSGKDAKVSFLMNYIYKMKSATFDEKIKTKIFKLPDSRKTNLLSSLEKFDKNIRDYFYEFINNQSHKDNLSLIRSFHQLIFNKHSPSGGFESINRTVKAQYLYFPFAMESTLNWPLDYFLNRKILTELIKRKIPEVANIPDQDLNRIDKGTNKYVRTIKKQIFGNGLDYRDWYSTDILLKKNCLLILKKKNPIFEKIVNKNVSYNELIRLHPNIVLDIVKIKGMLDIIYYRNFEKIRNSEFEMK